MEGCSSVKFKAAVSWAVAVLVISSLGIVGACFAIRADVGKPEPAKDLVILLLLTFASVGFIALLLLAQVVAVKLATKRRA